MTVQNFNIDPSDEAIVDAVIKRRAPRPHHGSLRGSWLGQGGERVVVSLSKEDKAALCEFASAMGVTLSEAVRQLIRTTMPRKVPKVTP